MCIYVTSEAFDVSIAIDLLCTGESENVLQVLEISSGRIIEYKLMIINDKKPKVLAKILYQKLWKINNFRKKQFNNE